jgi:PAS domain S-box-containing protein
MSGLTELTPTQATARGSVLPRTLGSSRARWGVVVCLVVGIHVLRVVVGDSATTGVSELLVLPVAVVGIDRGIWAGAMAAVAAYAIFLVWVLTGQVTGVEAAGHLTRGCLFLLTGIVTGWSAEQLREARTRQSQLADAIGDLVCVLDADARYLYVSAAAKELLGYEPAEMIGTSVFDHLHPDDARTVGASLSSLAHGGSPPQRTVHRVCRADGRYAWLETVMRVRRARDEVAELLCSSRDVTQREVQRLAIEEDEDLLRRQVQQVLDDRGIEPVFQRVVDLATGQTIGYEALARFPANAERPPNVWFDQAARVGLGEQLELLAIECALEQFGLLPDDVWLSVNASPRTLAAPRLLDVIRTVPPARLMIELTEHAEILDYEAFNAGTTGLRDLGVRVAVDDAGAGFASLRHILDIRPDVIKLDMTLTRHIDRDPARRALATALHGFAGTLNATVIAEGIEDRSELDELLVLGIDQGQGYFLGRPEPLPIDAH